MLRGFDKHLQEKLKKDSEFTREYKKLFAELPLQTQLGIMRRRRMLSQRSMAKKMKVMQPHVARTESNKHDPRISSIVRAAKAIHCHVILVADEDLGRIPTA